MRHIDPNGRSVRKVALTVTATVALYASLFAASMVASAQREQPQAATEVPSTSAFDVASVKPVNLRFNRPFDSIEQLGWKSHYRYSERISARDAPLRGLIQMAYDVWAHQIVGLPGWADSARYEIDARSEILCHRHSPGQEVFHRRPADRSREPFEECGTRESKMAIEGFTGSLAHELGAFNIRVKLVEPGYAPTTRFTANGFARMEGLFPEEYAAFANPILAEFSQVATVTKESDVAEAVYRAANDVSGQLRFPAGADAVALAQSACTRKLPHC